MVTLNLRDDCNGRVATNFKRGMTDKRFLELEITAWLTSPERKKQLEGEAYYDGYQDVTHRERLALDEDGKPIVLKNLPNNRLVNNLYSKMVDQKTNYSFGRPLSFDTENKEYAKALGALFGARFLRTMHNVGEGAWIGGKSWLYPYYENGELAFRRFPADEVLPFWADADHTILDAAVHVYVVQEYDEAEHAKDVVKVEVMHGGGVDCFIRTDDGVLEPDSFAYSPAALLAELKAKPPQFDTTVCEATLYNYIYRGDVFLVLNPEHLHEKGRRHYGEKYGEQRNAARAAKGPRIDKRDPIINSRTTFGHWEMDSVMGTVGSSRALVVLTERLTRAGIILPVPDHTAASVVRALNGLERRLGKDFYPMFQSITVDNGCEFQDYDGMEKACRRKGKRTTVYYCHPHAPHERGSNENMNRIIRRFFPKGTNFDEVPISEIRRAEEWMNNYPREVLGWQTAATLLRSYMSAC